MSGPGARAARAHAGVEPAATQVADALARIRAADASSTPLHAFLSVDDDALQEARAVDARCAAGERPTLAGVPVAVKDNLCTLRLPTTCGSRMLEAFRAPYEATVVRRLRAAGAVVVGKTNLDEFAMGSSTEHSAFGPTRHPRDPRRVPGGSSGGSAAAVAAGLVPAALGTDTGGSVRQPAAFCGIVGIRPTWGRVSRYGLVAYASSLDQVGTFGRTVADAALLLQVVAGADARDPTCAAVPVPDLVAASAASAAGLVVGVPRASFPADPDPAIAAACERAIALLVAAGARVRDVRLPALRDALATYYVIAPAEAASNLARFDGVRFGRRTTAARTVADACVHSRTEGFGEEVRRRIMLGTYVLGHDRRRAFFERACRVRERIAREHAAAFADVDVLVTPATPTPAFLLGEKREPEAMYEADVFTVGASLAGVPALSLPCGAVAGLPIGVQLIADRFREDVLVRAAGALERARDAAP